MKTKYLFKNTERKIIAIYESKLITETKDKN